MLIFYFTYLTTLLISIIIKLTKDFVIKARYVYDAWGNHKVLNPEGTENTSSTFIGNVNPIRYRGYYYDKDLKLYYLINRYYDPTIGQFISPDSAQYLDPTTIGGVDLYAYCLNNPVMYIDPYGHGVITIAIVMGLAFIAGYLTGRDVGLISKGNVKAESITEANGEQSVQIKNSYKIITPWVIYGYSFYLAHINEETKDIIKGSAFGVAYEWELHNLAYYGFNVINGAMILFNADNTKIKNKMYQAMHVEVGATIFSDKHKEGLDGIFSILMKFTYISAHPIIAIIDLIINGGF